MSDLIILLSVLGKTWSSVVKHSVYLLDVQGIVHLCVTVLQSAVVILFLVLTPSNSSYVNFPHSYFFFPFLTNILPNSLSFCTNLSSYCRSSNQEPQTTVIHNPADGNKVYS